MRFLMLVKHGENPGPPPPEFLAAMAKLGEDAAKSGTMIASGGLMPISKSTRVRLARGQLTAIDGPYTEARSEEHTSELQSRRHLVCRLDWSSDVCSSDLGGRRII